MNANQGFVIAFLTPVLCAMLTAVYSYFDFASNAITSPNIWIATFLVASYTWVLASLISIFIYGWRFT
jgi:hypothetical protein